jgi:membrane fusion protein (multidrug efflux system)
MLLIDFAYAALFFHKSNYDFHFSFKDQIEPAQMNRTTKTIVLVVIFLAIVAFIIYPRVKTNEQSVISPKTGISSALPVDVKVIPPRQIENVIRVTGTILANESVALKSEISGRAEKIFFREGQSIKKGDILLKINDEEIKAQVERLRYTQKLNEDSEYRQRQLLEKEAISREEYEIALTTLNTTLADIKEKEANLAKHSIIAPFDGVIGLRQVSEGSYLTPNDLVCNIYSLNPAKIEFSVPGKYTNEIEEGDSISFSTEASVKRFYGVVYAFEPRIDPATRTLKIRAISPNKAGDLLPGQFVNIDYILEVVPNALMVPSVAVIPEMNGHKLFLYRGDKAIQQNVQIGLRTDTEVQIVDGVSANDTVIVTGILQMRPGISLELNSIQ